MAEIGPLVAAGVVEPVGHGAIGAVDDTRAARVLDAGYSLLVL